MYKKYIWVLAVIIIIITSIAVTFKVKSSFISQPMLSEMKNNSNEINFLMCTEEELELAYPFFSTNITNIESLIEESQIIAKVRPVNDGIPVSYSLRRECEVIELIKGNIVDTSSNIYVYEPSYLWGPIYKSLHGYIGMDEKEEYIVFLNPIKNSEFVDKIEYTNGYLFSSIQFSKFKVGEFAKTISDNINSFNDLEDLPVYFTNETEVKIYNSILSDIENIY